MKYDGLIGKIGNAIPNNSTAKFAGVGAAVVAPIGAGLSYYENQDWGDAAAGALRSAAFGGILGAVTHRLPGIVASNTTGKGLVPITEEVIPGIGRSLTNNLGWAREGFKQDINFFNTFQNQAKTLASMDAFVNGAELAGVRESLINNGKILSSMTKTEQAKTLLSQTIGQGFNSAYHHIVQPAGRFFKGEMNLETTAAAAFSAYGVYEAGQAINNVRQGNYTEASKDVGMLALMKLNYAGLSSLVKVNNSLKKAGISYGDLYNGYKVVKQNPELAAIAGLGGDKLLATSYVLSPQAKNIRNAMSPQFTQMAQAFRQAQQTAQAFRP